MGGMSVTMTGNMERVVVAMSSWYLIETRLPTGGSEWSHGAEGKVSTHTLHTHLITRLSKV